MTPSTPSRDPAVHLCAVVLCSAPIMYDPADDGMGRTPGWRHVWEEHAQGHGARPRACDGCGHHAAHTRAGGCPQTVGDDHVPRVCGCTARWDTVPDPRPLRDLHVHIDMRPGATG